MAAADSTMSMFTSTSTVITGGSFVQQHIGNVDNRVEVRSQGVGFDLLQRAVAPAAFHDSGERFDPPRCHPNTRTAVLNKIMEWATGRDATPEMRQAFLMWLHGPAGAGKSAIAQSITELCQEAGISLAAFFFSRTDPSRNHAQSLVASIVYQMIIRLPEAKDLIVALVEQDPLIFTRSIPTQFDTLLFRPLEALLGQGKVDNLPFLIVIDGLDECTEPKAQIQVLDAFHNAHSQGRLPSPLRVLIASRPEPHIVSSFHLQSIGTHLLALDNTYHPNHDIRLFLNDKFKEIAATHLYSNTIPSGWPGDDVIEVLVDKSSGQFIYASTVVKYVSSVRHRPTKQLEVVLGLRPAQRLMPFAELDALYTHVLSSAEDLEVVLKILALRILGLEATTTSMEALLGLEYGDIPVMLGDLGSLVQCVPMSTLSQTPDLNVQIFHASLKDFLFDKSRSKNMYLDPRLRHAEFAHLGFRYLAQKMTNHGGSVSHNESITRDVLQSIPHHLRHATLTENLRSDIRDFSGEALIKSFEMEGWKYMGDLLTFWCRILQTLEGANDLHRFHTRQFNQFLRSNIGPYFVEPYLTFLLALASVEHLPSSDVPAPTARIIKIDSERLRILSPSYRSRKIQFDGPYLTMLRKFLSDPEQCGTDGLTSQAYTTAVLYCLKDLMEDWASLSGLPASTDPGRYELHSKYFLSRPHSQLPCIKYAERLLEKAVSVGPSITLSNILECKLKQQRPRRRHRRRYAKSVLNYNGGFIEQHIKQHSIDDLDEYPIIKALILNIARGRQFEGPAASIPDNQDSRHTSPTRSIPSSLESSGNSTELAGTEVACHQDRRPSRFRKVFSFSVFRSRKHWSFGFGNKRKKV